MENVYQQQHNRPLDFSWIWKRKKNQEIAIDPIYVCMCVYDITNCIHSRKKLQT
mgnify:CR=1 FL=1